MSKRYAIAVQTNDEGVLEVWTTDPALTWRDANEAQEFVRRQVPAGQNVIIVPLKTMLSGELGVND